MTPDTRLYCADCGREGSIMEIAAGWSELAHVAAPELIHPFRLAPRSAHHRDDEQSEASFETPVAAGDASPTRTASSLRVTPTASGGDDVREDPSFPRPVATTGRRTREMGNSRSVRSGARPAAN